MERLCPTCKVECHFRKDAEKVATSNVITPPDKSQQISSLRVDARERMCPNLNDIDPWYEGKDKL